MDNVNCDWTNPPVFELLEPRLMLDGVGGPDPVNPSGAAPPAAPASTIVDDRQFNPSSRMSGLIVSEIMYNPLDPDGVGGIDPDDLEFIEIYNSEEVPNDLSQYELTGEVDFVFAEGTVLAGRSYLVVASNPAVAESFYGITGVLGPYSEHLTNDGGTQRLRNQMYAILQEIQYSDDYPWPAAADGAGHSLVMTRPDYGEDSVEAWEASDYVNGNPGTHNRTFTDGLADIAINEVLVHTDHPDIDFVELYNYSNSTVDIGGLTISDARPDEPGYVEFTIPGGTTIAPRGCISFDQNQLGFSFNMQGDEVYLRNADGDRVIDAIKFGAQENGVSLGRYTDGADGFRVLSATTPGSTNAAPVNYDIVINEIMYHPISEDIGYEFVELYNRGVSDVQLDNWRFIEGIRYTFPVGTTIYAGGYLVVAKNALQLIAAHPGVLDAANTVGDFSGSLSDRGERIVLARPDDPLLPLQDFVVVDEVLYTDGESWGTWADRGGSSLELIDPYSDNMRGENWADSDETAKAPWTLVTYTGELDLGRNAANEVQILLEGKGEALLDNVEVFKAGGGNRVANGTFESGIGGWVIQGTHIDSYWETGEGYNSSRSMHLVSSRTGDNSVNRVEHDLSSTLYDGETATIQARVRWLCGTPGILLRVHGNWIEAPGIMDIPANLGTPGAVNSRYSANAGPAIYDVTHLPVLPATGEDVVVTARVADVDGLSSVELKYRNDTDNPSTTYTVGMNDSGVSGDAIAGDGIYSGTIPGQGVNDLVAFYVQATDSHGSPVTTRFPTDAPDKEAHVMFGQTSHPGTFGTYRFWMTEADRAEWQNRQRLSDHPIHGTFVYGDFRVVYNASGRFKGSPWIRKAGDPETLETNYILYVPKDDRVTGSTSFNMDRLERDDTQQREHMSLWLADQIDIPFFNQRYVHMYVNETLKDYDEQFDGTFIFADSHSTNDDYVNAYWSDGTGGDLFKIDHWFEFTDGADVQQEFADNARLGFYETNGQKNQGRYRWSWRKDPLDGFNDDYSSFFDLIDAVNHDYRSAEFAATVPLIVDYDEWMRTFALQHVVVNWDSYSFATGKNMSLYLPDDGQWQMITWDLDYNPFRYEPDADNLFSIEDPLLKNDFFNYPLFLRAYWRAIYDLAGMMEASKIEPVMDANYAAFVSNGLSVVSPDEIGSPYNHGALTAWTANRRSFLLGKIAAIDAPFGITTNGGADFSTGQQIVTIEGTAPVAVKTMYLNGNEVEVDFSSITAWEVQLGLAEGDNVLTFEGFDFKGNLVASDTITVTFTNTAVSPLGQIVINEIMYNPAAAVEHGEYIEIHNVSHTTAFDMSGWRINGADFTFGPGSIITAGEYVIVAENAANFIATYGSGATVMGQYNGRLSNDGERLRLQMPAGGLLWTTVDEVTYDDALPWPAAADGTGPSLQLIDPTRDNGWIGNWAADSSTHYTPGEVNSVYEILPAVPQVRINEIMGSNVSTLLDNAGQYDPWVELFEAGSTNVMAVEVHQADPNGGDATMELSLTFSEPGGPENVSLVSAGSTWKYLDDGSDQGDAWRQLGYNDSGWDSGAGRLGYGDSDGRITTYLSYGPNANDKYITYYFRHKFWIDNAAEFTSLDLLVQRDDGIIVYLNDSEVLREYMPTSGEITYETLASGTVYGDNEVAWAPPQTPANPGHLVDGWNIMAVEIHQISVGSSDMGFDMSLDGMRTTIDQITEIIPLDATWNYLDDGSDQGTTWRDPGFDDGAWSGGAAILGYGNGDEATALAADRTTYYFRHVIDLQETAIVNPELIIRADDGAIVYLNGTEVLRVNMPAGPVDFTTEALTPIEGGAEADFAEIMLDPGLFQTDVSPGVLTDVHLTDDYTQPFKWSFQADTPLAVGEYMTVWVDAETAQQTPTDMHANFAIDGLPGSLAVVWDHNGAPIVVDYVDYDYTPDDQSQGRWPNALGDVFAMDSPTPTAYNSGPALGPVVITEVHYNPADLDDYEFIEIFNRSAAAVNMWETYDTIDYPWEIEGFEFAVGASLSPGETMVIVPFDPIAEPAALTAFKARYGLELSGVQIVGGYGNYLDDGGEMIRLERPLRLVGDPAFTPYETVDAVRYDDELPWPTAPDGGGDSLHRLSAGAWGNAVDNWTAAPHNPGTFSYAPTADIIDVAPDPRNSAVAEIDIVFSEAVTGFNIGHLSLTLDGGADLLPGPTTLSTSDNITWTLGNLTGLTGAGGTYTLLLTAAGSGIRDAVGNPLAGDASDMWQTVAPLTLTWDGADPAEWTSARWNPGPVSPGGGEAMVVDSGTVAVSADLTTTPGAAASLHIAYDAPDGALNIGAAGVLVVEGDVNVGAGGTLNVDGVLIVPGAAVSPITVNGTLSGSGTIHGSIIIIGSISPGSDPPVVPAGANVALTNGSTFQADVMDAATEDVTYSYQSNDASSITYPVLPPQPVAPQGAADPLDAAAALFAGPASSAAAATGIPAVAALVKGGRRPSSAQGRERGQAPPLRCGASPLSYMAGLEPALATDLADILGEQLGPALAGR